MIRHFCQMEDEVRKHPMLTISVAVAQDEEILRSVKGALDRGFANSILVGDEAKIRPLMKKIGLPDDMRVVDATDDAEACRQAVLLVRKGDAQVLFKGLVNTSFYLRAALAKEEGLRTGRLFSTLHAYEIPRDDRLLFATDTGLNICPNLEEKKEILWNTIDALMAFGIDHPYIGILAANELVNPKMPVTVEADEIAKAFTADPDFHGTIEGPVSLDVAVSANAAKHKGIASRIAGKTDVFLFPTVEAGNIWSKSMMHYANINAGGLIVGATHPIILMSRADDAVVKMNSIVMSCFVANKGVRK